MRQALGGHWLAEMICKGGCNAAGPTAGIGLENMRHVISIHDVVSDTMHQFAPTYHDYVLYSNGGGKEAPKTVRSWSCQSLRVCAPRRSH